MPIKSFVKPEHNLVIMVHEGVIPDDEFLAFYKSFFAGEEFVPSMNLLVDLREADSSARSSGVLRHFAEYVGTVITNGPARAKVAVVAQRDLSFGIARMYEAFSESVPWDFVVFRAIDAALAWLGVPDSVVDGLDREVR